MSKNRFPLSASCTSTKTSSRSSASFFSSFCTRVRDDNEGFAPNSQSFLAKLDSIAARCNYADYFEKHVTYPPKGVLPLPGKSTEADRGCDVWDTIFDAALAVNPAFNIYRIFDTVRTISPPSSPSLVLTKSLIVLIFPADAFPPF